MEFKEANEAAPEDRHFIKLKVRDSVFGDLFHDKRYLLQLYQTLHPEDTTVSEDDFTDVTIRNVLVNDLYNDLGFMLRGTLIILCECQSAWTLNIIIRALLYMARTYQMYFKEHGTDLYSTKKIFLPRPELYVIYIGDEKNKPDEISLSKEFFNGEEAAIDVKVKVICESDGTDIINQYIIFSKVYAEQQKIYRRTREAITETIRICKDRNILREYLESREKEVIDIMMALFDEQEIYDTHFNSVGREFEEKGRAEGRAKEREENIKKIAQNYLSNGLADNMEDALQKAEALLS